ncbi:MAG: curli production assembly/transport protein CsgE [Vibrio sp.]
MNPFVFILVLLLPFMTITPVYAEQESNLNDTLSQIQESLKEQNNELQHDISGVVVDRTMTRFGADFYSVFSQLLADKSSSDSENLLVKERATALSGSIISVFHNQKLIYRTAISPARQQIEFKAKQAVDQVDKYLLQWKVQQHFQDTFDLAKDEF